MKVIRFGRRLLFSLLVALPFIAAAAPPPGASPQPEAIDVEHVLEEVRKAVGFRALQRHSGGILVRGRASRLGSEGSYSLRFRPSGEFVAHVQAALSDTVGFDGSRGWAADWSGMPRILHLEDLEVNQLAVWVPTGRWLAEAGPFDVELAGEPSTDGPVELDLRLRGKRLKARLEVDRATWLPSVLRRQTVTGTDEWRFRDYRSDLGFKYPGRTTETIGALSGTYEVLSIAAVDEPLPGIPPPPRDTRFSAEIPPEITVRRTRTGHTLVRPRLDDADLGWFVLDTGAGQSAITPAAAERMRLEPVGTVTASTVYGTAPAAVYRARSLLLGPVRISDPFLIEMDLDFLEEPLGTAVSGIVGYDLLSRCVVEILLTGESVRLFDPGTYDRPGVPWRDLILHQKLPAVRARFEGEREGIFRLDVGAGGAFGNVVFHAPAVEEMNLVGGRRVTRGEAAGQDYAAGRIAWFELAGRRFENPEVVFFLDERGPLTDAYLTGNIGVRLLEAFRIILDYPHGRLALIERAEGGP